MKSFFGKNKSTNPSNPSNLSLVLAPHTLEHLQTQTYTLEQINTMLLIADKCMDASNPGVFRVAELSDADAHDVLETLDLPNALQMSNLDRLTHTVNRLLLKDPKKTSAIHIFLSEVTKTLFRRGPLLNLESTDNQNDIEIWSQFRNQLINVLGDYYQKLDEQESNTGQPKVNDKLEFGLVDAKAVQSSVLEFLGELTKQKNFGTAQAIHNFIYLIRKTMLENMKKDKDKNPATFAIFLSPCLVDGLSLNETLMMTYKSDAKVRVAEYAGFQAFSQILLETEFFDRPYHSSMYHMLSQKSNTKSGMRLSDGLKSLRLHRLARIPQMTDSLENLAVKVKDLNFDPQAFDEELLEDKDPSQIQRMCDIFSQIEEGKTSQNSPEITPKKTSTSFLVPNQANSTTPERIEIESYGSLVNVKKQRSKPTVHDVFTTPATYLPLQQTVVTTIPNNVPTQPTPGAVVSTQDQPQPVNNMPLDTSKQNRLQ